MDYKSVFTNLCLELQQNRSWIKGLGKNPFTHSLTAVPFVRGTEACFPRTPRNTGVYTRHPTFVTATSGVFTRLLAKLSKNGMRVYTLSDRQSKNLCCVYTASEAKGLIQNILAKIFSKNNYIGFTQNTCMYIFIVTISSWSTGHGIRLLVLD